MINKSREHRGNILFLILLAIILFVALSYAVKQSLQGGGKNTSAEELELAVSQIYQNAALLDVAIKRRHFLGIRPENMDFSSGSVDPRLSANAINTTCVGSECKLFAIRGGDINMSILPATIMAPGTVPGTFVNNDLTPRYFFVAVSVKDMGTNLPELVAWITGVSLEVCDAINQKEGIAQPGDAYTNDNIGSLGTAYGSITSSGVWPTTYTPNALGDTDTRMAGRSMFCVRNSSGGYIIYQVLLVF